MVGARSTAVLIIVLLTAGCSKVEDDPANIPKLGSWNTKIELASVNLDGETYEGFKIPKDVADSLGGWSKSDELGCTEPKVASVEALNAKLPSNIAAMCKIKPTGGDPSNFSFESECDNSKLPASVTAMQFTGEAEVLPDKVYMTFRVDVTANGADGASETTKIVQKRNFWRVGECPA